MESESELEPTPKKWISLALSMKYITNITILASIIGYYTQAYWIFLVSIPLLITNAIVMTLLEWFNSYELIAAVLDIPLSHPELIKASQVQFTFINTVWHWIPLAWLWYILNEDNLIKVFQPNFMGCFLSGATFGICYFNFASQGKYYGEIDYSWYMIVYVIVLLTTCISVYPLTA
jgi:hypothetical protein